MKILNQSPEEIQTAFDQLKAQEIEAINGIKGILDKVKKICDGSNKLFNLLENENQSMDMLNLIQAKRYGKLTSEVLEEKGLVGEKRELAENNIYTIKKIYLPF